eukprot:scaffold575005_cov118-Attheya_sp.AAC.1
MRSIGTLPTLEECVHIAMKLIGDVRAQMTFLAQPSDVTSILGGLKYKTSKAMTRETIVNDVVVVRVMDGVG